MSEKRHASLDAKSTETYQRRKKARFILVNLNDSFNFCSQLDKFLNS